MPSRLCGIWTDQIRRPFFGVVTLASLVALSVPSIAHAQSSLETIRVGGIDTNNGATPFFVAQKMGFFKDVGLDAKYVTMGGGAAPMAAALRAGELDVAIAGALQHMQDIARGVIVGKIIGEITDSNNYVILGREGVADVKQLKGKVFGISSYNGGDQLYAQAVFGHFGMGLDDVPFVPVGVPTSRMAALMSGRIDATVISEHQMPESAMDKVKVVLSAESSPVPFVSGAIFARQEILTSNKLMLQKFLAAIGKGADWARTHPDDALLGCQESGSSVEACRVAIKVAMSAKDSYTWSSTTRVNADSIAAMIPLYAPVVPQLKNKTVSDFIDTSVAAGVP